MGNKNVVTARIFGSEYTIVGTESSEYIAKVCSTVDEKMRSLAQSPALNPMRTAVLCSVNICDEMFKCEEKLNDALGELEELKKEISALNTKNRVLNEENNYLKRELKNARTHSGDKSNGR